VLNAAEGGGRKKAEEGESKRVSYCQQEINSLQALRRYTSEGGPKSKPYRIINKSYYLVSNHANDNRLF